MQRKAPDISGFPEAHAFIYQLLHTDARFRRKYLKKMLELLLPQFLLKQEL